ncbi:tRNA uridine-5-carboxymethylaminomethyl(34) synthesis GTPase MnmE [Terriglobus saanensis]|uniref:tRNA modification GTPase MnmE n=1 Tax=Terriglobus saanensis (strain ATCC BAA-1853 / DSM 23119 / SP1PR4) TaxID=401053 RepID=E8V6Z3_TERSS|nr:tRNA uridine-5-carboxymethylaminomethyl(34) synthesis GTPase MnmE [Terriglobus saanensis]ADV85017.1 tRNA modification GTPase TrmE [Terriglobus saanensis SP1PR4]
MAETTTQDTIVAVSTPPGRGGIGIVRLSGPEARGITEKLLALETALEPRRARFAHLNDETGQRIDDAVVTFFAAPNSYTGEDVIEIAAHGSPVVLEWIVRRACTLGARPAHAGEFTERAFFRGRIDLTQAEAVRDLIDAQTIEQARVAAEQVGGSLAKRIRPCKEDLVALIALLEAGIDFAEDDIDVAPSAQIEARLQAVLSPLEDLLATFAYGRILREGVRIAVIGRPNAGKSSLFNALAERERAIVTPIAGTTRDVVTERVSIGGIPVELMDTAGLRESEDFVEQLGIARSREALAEADLVLFIVDLQHGISEEERETIASLEGRPHLVVANKIDLAPLLASDFALIPTSANTGEGLDRLREALLQQLRGSQNASASGLLTNLRQRDAVARAVEALHRAIEAIHASIPHEMLLLDIYEALRGLDELTGSTTADEILGVIFSTFCIGK